MQLAWDTFRTGAREGLDQAKLLDGLGLGSRYCCRRMLLAQPLALESAPDPQPRWSQMPRAPQHDMQEDGGQEDESQRASSSASGTRSSKKRRA
jgi:DNA-directed RNA polymerase subunit N (RpoN/RPB10)